MNYELHGVCCCNSTEQYYTVHSVAHHGSCYSSRHHQEPPGERLDLPSNFDALQALFDLVLFTPSSRLNHRHPLASKPIPSTCSFIPSAFTSPLSLPLYPHRSPCSGLASDSRQTDSLTTVIICCIDKNLGNSNSSRYIYPPTTKQPTTSASETLF